VIYITKEEDLVNLKLTELRRRWDKEWERNNTLESKATTLMGAAGTMTTLIFGFVTLAQSTTKFELVPQIIYLIILSIIFSISSIISAIAVLSIREYLFPLRIASYFKNEDFKPDLRTIHSTNFADYQDVEKFLDTTPIDMIANYLNYIRVIHLNSENKASLISASIVFLVFSAIFTGIAAAAILWSQPIHQATDGEKGQFTCNELEASTTRSISNNKLIDVTKGNASKLMLCFGN